MATVAEAFAMGTRHHQAGQLSEAEQFYRQVLESQPDHPHALHQLGMLAIERGQFEAAIDLISKAIQAEPTQGVFHANLGDAYLRSGKGPQAVASFRKALALQPTLAQAHAQLGAALFDQGNLAEAGPCFRAVLELTPLDHRAHYNFGRFLQGLGRLSEAAIRYRAALAICPLDTDARNNLGAVLIELGHEAEAVSHFRRVTEIRPGSAAAFANLSSVLHRTGGLDAGVVAAQRAIELDPTLALAHASLANCLQSLGRLDEAIEAFRQSVRYDPEHAPQHSNLLYVLNFSPNVKPEAVFAEHRAWAERHADPLTAAAPPHANDRSPDRRLRVGYVSPLLIQSAVNAFVEPIFASHDHARFEVFAYADAAKSDASTERLRGYVDHWRDLPGQTDEQAAELIRRDQIDVLVDLTGHILGGSRLLTFARKPAPIQVTYLGYQNTTGMRAMDYRLTDAYADPPGTTEQFYTEELVRLPDTFFCYQAPAGAPPIAPLPAVANGYVTFGSFNNFGKVTPAVLQTWAGILQRVPESRLVILAHVVGSLRERVLATFARQGVAADRLEFASRRPTDQYLALMSSVDVALDPFPFNGHTTTCDSLWMGLPVVTLSGNSYVSRFGGVALAQLGLQDLIAQTSEDYQEIAVRLANNRERLTTLRRGLRERMIGSSIMNARQFTRNLEDAYRQMWTRWCSQAAAGQKS